MTTPDAVTLRGWTADDLPLLRGLLGDPAMMTYLGGPESEEKLLARHQRYLDIARTTGRVFVITAGPYRTAAGWIGYWETTWHGEPSWETGWSVLPQFQGRGLATRGAALAVEAAAAEGRHRFIYAFPAVANGPSNAVAEARLRAAGQRDARISAGHLDGVRRLAPGVGRGRHKQTVELNDP